jgi:predicted DNA-binding transcriptional regulator AlpA
MHTTDEKPPGILDEYVDVPALAKELGKAPRTIWRWRAQRKGPPGTWLGDRLFFRKEAVRQWLLQREEPTR